MQLSAAGAGQGNHGGGALDVRGAARTFAVGKVPLVHQHDKVARLRTVPAALFQVKVYDTALRLLKLLDDLVLRECRQRLRARERPGGLRHCSTRRAATHGERRTLAGREQQPGGKHDGARREHAGWELR